jgi:hypothetical protein
MRELLAFGLDATVAIELLAVRLEADACVEPGKLAVAYSYALARLAQQEKA